MARTLLDDGVSEAVSGTNFLAIHIILKALEDYFNDGEDDESEFFRGSAQIFFAGFPETSTYRLFLEWLGYDVEELGVITPERWIEVIDEEYSSIGDAKPKIGLSTRLIPRDSPLWKRIRQGRSRRPGADYEDVYSTI